MLGHITDNSPTSGDLETVSASVTGYGAVLAALVFTLAKKGVLTGGEAKAVVDLAVEGLNAEGTVESMKAANFVRNQAAKLLAQR